MTDLPPDIQGLSLVDPSFEPKDISLPLPLTPHTSLHIRLSLLEKTTLVFLTSTDYTSSGTSSTLGSFVYAMPNNFATLMKARQLTDHQRLEPSNPLCTPLITVPSSLEFGSRVAKILARRTGKPTYVGCSVGLGGATIEEEIEGVKAVIGAIMAEVAGATPKVNGV